MPLTTLVHRALSGTPLWVWALLAALIALGLTQARTRVVHELRLAALPLGMAAYSFYGLSLQFGLTAAGMAAWAVGLATGLAAGLSFGALPGARPLPATRSFVVPGSWVPLGVILALFLSRYVVAVSLAMNPELRSVDAFGIGACLAYGLLGGYFPARALRIWMFRRSTTEGALS